MAAVLACRLDPGAAPAPAAAGGAAPGGGRRRAARHVRRAAATDGERDRAARAGGDLMRDRRGLAVLATGHLWTDVLQGSVPALLPAGPLSAGHGSPLTTRHRPLGDRASRTFCAR